MYTYMYEGTSLLKKLHYITGCRDKSFVLVVFTQLELRGERANSTGNGYYSYVIFIWSQGFMSNKQGKKIELMQQIKEKNFITV